MKNLIRVFAVIFMIIFIVSSCEKDPPMDENYQSQFIGTWDVIQKEGLNSPQNYPVEIRAGANQNEIIIEGLYNSPAVSIMADIYGLSLEIPTQKSDSITFSGSGQANLSFDQITINFVANDGSFDDHVKAILTPN